MSRIIVQIGGGLIRDVYKIGRGDPKEVVVVDLEAEKDEIDSNPDLATKYTDEDGKEATAIVQDFGFVKLRKDSDVMRSVKAWEKDWKFFKDTK